MSRAAGIARAIGIARSFSALPFARGMRTEDAAPEKHQDWEQTVDLARYDAQAPDYDASEHDTPEHDMPEHGAPEYVIREYDIQMRDTPEPALAIAVADTGGAAAGKAGHDHDDLDHDDLDDEEGDDGDDHNGIDAAIASMVLDIKSAMHAGAGQDREGENAEDDAIMVLLSELDRLWRNDAAADVVYRH